MSEKELNDDRTRHQHSQKPATKKSPQQLPLTAVIQKIGFGSLTSHNIKKLHEVVGNQGVIQLLEKRGQRDEKPEPTASAEASKRTSQSNLYEELKNSVKDYVNYVSGSTVTLNRNEEYQKLRNISECVSKCSSYSLKKPIDTSSWSNLYNNHYLLLPLLNLFVSARMTRLKKKPEPAASTEASPPDTSTTSEKVTSPGETPQSDLYDKLQYLVRDYVRYASGLTVTPDGNEEDQKLWDIFNCAFDCSRSLEEPTDTSSWSNLYNNHHLTLMSLGLLVSAEAIRLNK